jgi:hypothetical protein
MPIMTSGADRLVRCAKAGVSLKRPGKVPAEER